MKIKLNSIAASRWTLYGLAYILLIIYLNSFSQYGFNIWDEGGYANGTLRTLNGQTAIKDFNPNGYAPGRYLYGLLFFKLFGVELQSLRHAVVFLTPAMVLMVYWISRRWLPRSVSVFAALMMLSAPSMYYNRFYTLFTVFNLFFLIGLLERKNLFYLAGFTLSVMVSLSFKIEVATYSIVIFLFTALLLIITELQRKKDSTASTENPLGSLVATNPKAFRAFIILTSLAISAAVLYFIRIDLFPKAWDLVVKAHGVWGNPLPTLFPFFALYKEWGPHEMFERLLFYLPIITYCITAILLIQKVVKSRMTFNTATFQLMVTFLFGLCAFGLVLYRAGFDNLLRTLPPFYILLCYLLYRADTRLKQALITPSTGSRMKKIHRIVIFFTIYCLPLGFIAEMNINHGFYAGSIGAVKQETTLINLDRMNVYTNSTEAEWIKQVTKRIEEWTEKGDPILVLPLNPIFYFITDRVNPTPYDWVLPGMLKEKEELAMVEQLKKNPPRMIVYVDIAIDGKEERRLSNYAPHLFEFIALNYELKELAGFFQLLLPYDGLPANND